MNPEISPADVLRRYLISVNEAVSPTGTVGSSDWPIVTAPMPELDRLSQPRDNYISVVDTGGFTEPGRNRDGGARVVHPTCQVMVRAKDYMTGKAKAGRIERAFDKIGSEPPDGVGRPLVIVGSDRVVILAVHVMTPATWVGQDEQNRRQDFSVNVRSTFADG